MLTQLWHPDDRESADRTIDDAVRDKRSYEMDVRVVRPDGSIRYLHIRGQPVFDQTGEIDEFIGVVMDITDRKRAERALRRARERTLEARFAAVLEERTRLARDIHDTLLQGFTGIALKLVAAINRVTGPAESVGALRDLVGLAQQTLTDARRAVWDLRSPALAAGDFPAALRTAAEDCVRGTTARAGVRRRRTAPAGGSGCRSRGGASGAGGHHQRGQARGRAHRPGAGSRSRPAGFVCPSSTTVGGSPSHPTSRPTGATGGCSVCGSAPVRFAASSRSEAPPVTVPRSCSWCRMP